MSDNEIRMITNSIDEMRKSFDRFKDVFNTHCLDVNEKMSSLSNRVTILEIEKPRIEKAKQYKFEWLTKFVLPFISPFISAGLAIIGAFLVFKLTKG
jgi:hypothetical protein